MKAILICGAESVSFKGMLKVSDLNYSCLNLYHYLRKNVRLPEENIFSYDGRGVLRLKANGIANEISRIIALDPYEPLVLYYGGHGLDGGWKLYKKSGKAADGYSLDHKKLANVLQKQQGPLIIIADCCYAMSLKKRLKKLSCKLLLLGLSPENLVGYGSVVNQLVRKWASRKIANPLYDNSYQKVRYVKVKRYLKPLGWICIVGKKSRRYYPQGDSKKVKLVLRQGDDLDYLLYPKIKNRH